MTRLIRRISLTLALLLGIMLIGQQTAEAGKWRRHARRAVHVRSGVHVRAPYVGVHVGHGVRVHAPGVRVHVGSPYGGAHYHHGAHYYRW